MDEQKIAETPITDMYNLSLHSTGYENWPMWCYEVALYLDKIIPLQNYTNAQRIELAVKKLALIVEDRAGLVEALKEAKPYVWAVTAHDFEPTPLEAIQLIAKIDAAIEGRGK